MAETLTQQFLAALHAGRACVHPTDTLPGLTFDPTSAIGRAAVTALKGRDEGKPFLGLVPSLAMARRFFAPLPAGWEAILTDVWPGPLSVIWEASELAPRPLVAGDGTICLRVPQLPVEAAWFRAVLDGLQTPLPSTSVNKSGDPPARSFAAAARLVQGAERCFAPAWGDDLAGADVAPSTIIRLHEDGAFTQVRAGALPLEVLAARAPRRATAPGR